MNRNRQKIIRIFGITAITGGIINAVSDLLLVCGPVSGKEADLLYMATHIPYAHTLVGTILGATLGIPLWLAILVPLYYALEPSGRWLCLPIVLVFGQMVISFAVYHGSAALGSAIYHLSADPVSGSQIMVTQMTDKATAFSKGMKLVMTFGVLASSIGMIVAILAKPTLYRRWMVMFTPIFCLPLMMASNHLPAPVGGYFAPMDGSLFFTLFFVVTTWVTWNYEKR